MLTRILTTALMVWAYCSTAGLAQEDQTNTAPQVQPDQVDKSTENPRPQSTVKTRSFYLKDGTLVMGRVISEDRNAIRLEELSGSRLIVATYGTRDVAAGTMQTSILPEYEYLGRLGDTPQ